MLDALYRIIVLDYISHHKLVEAKRRAERELFLLLWQAVKRQHDTIKEEKKEVDIVMSSSCFVLLFRLCPLQPTQLLYTHKGQHPGDNSSTDQICLFTPSGICLLNNVSNLGLKCQSSE